MRRFAQIGLLACFFRSGGRSSRLRQRAVPFRDGTYWVPIEGQWMAVPERAIIRDRRNPVGEAVVWYVHHRGGIMINCFVPADAV